MGGRGSFDKATMSIPVEKRKYKTLDVVDGIKIIEDFESGNGKTPVMSNTADTVYAVWSESAGRIKHIFYYKDHVLYYSIDLEGKKYFWNRNSSQWILNSEPKEIGCVHTSQGYDLNRVAVILGREIDYDPGTQSIVINRELFFDSKVKQQTTDTQLKQFIINAYKVMLVRGIKGCYVYAYNKNLREYLKQFIPVAK